MKHIRYITQSESITRKIQNEDLEYFLIRTDTVIDLTLDVLLERKNTNASVYVFVYAFGDANVSIVTSQLHTAPNTKSSLLVKTVLNDKAKMTFNGKIVVAPNASKTDAYQRNENILFSENAFATSKPTLEIEAGDVRCTHGAATSMVSSDELWYLKSRGICDQDAQKLIISGFFETAIDPQIDEITHHDMMQYILK